MTATTHAIIGTVIAAKIGNPALAIPLALASHYVVDAIPHWDTSYKRREKKKKDFFNQTVLDFGLGLVVSYVLIQVLFPMTNLPYAFFMIIMAQLPDWLVAPYLFLDWNFPPFNWIYKLGKVFDLHLGPPWGVVNQFAIAAAVIIFGRMF